MIFLELSHLQLPRDAIEKSPDDVQLIGELVTDTNEIIVISQLGRMIGTVYACRL